MKLDMELSEHPQRVLIVDDERHNRNLLEVMLQPEGYVLLTAASGEEALAIVTNDPPDLVLLDVMMPGMDGYQVAAVIKATAATRNIPIIIVTALDDRNSRMHGLSAGAEDFLTKPINRAELRVRVKNLLRLKAYGDYHARYSPMLESEDGWRHIERPESDRFYESTFEAAPVGLVHVGLDGKWLHTNQHVCDMLGYTREEIQNGAAQQLVEPDEATADAEFRRQIVNGAITQYIIDERWYPRQSGGFVRAKISTSAYRGSDGRVKHFVSVLEDITDRRKNQ